MAQPSPVISTAGENTKGPRCCFPCSSRHESTRLRWEQIRSGERSANGIISHATHARIIHCKGWGAHADFLYPARNSMLFIYFSALLSFPTLLLASAENGCRTGRSGRCPALAAERTSAGDCAQAPRAPEPAAPAAEPASAL